MKSIERSCFEEDLLWATAELCSIFGKKYVLSTVENTEVDSLPVREEFISALCSAILYNRSGDEEDRKNFLERARAAFTEVWRQKAISRKKGGRQ